MSVCSHVLAFRQQSLFYEKEGPTEIVHHVDIRQTKGEPEMSQFDWLVQNANKLHPGEAAVSIKTSGDIDALYIHLFALSLHWPRNDNGRLYSPVYVVLHTPGSKYDVYNVNLLLELLGNVYEDRTMGIKVAVNLCMGGNDFVPKLQQVSHSTFLKHVLKPKYRNSLPGRVAQSVTCLATDACLTAIPGVASSIPARSHTFVEIDHEIISTVILLPSADSFKKDCCQLQAKVCARITGYPLVQACPGKRVVR